MIEIKQTKTGKKKKKKVNGNDDSHQTTTNAHAMVGNNILAWCESMSYSS